MRTAIYAGTFDPITYGHLDIIRRGAALVDKLVVAVADTTGKDTMFDLDQRHHMVKDEIAHLSKVSANIEVAAFSGLLVDFAREIGATLILRGMRVVSDFEYEFQMACMNNRLNSEIETVFLTASENMQFTSSRFLKQIAELGGDISSLTTPRVAAMMRSHFAQSTSKEIA